MNDFLDRLATRAIGSESMLTPRLPSLFEPLSRVQVMAPAYVAEDVPHAATGAGVDPVAASKEVTEGAPSARPSVPRSGKVKSRMATPAPTAAGVLASRVDVPSAASAPIQPAPTSRNRRASQGARATRPEEVPAKVASSRHASNVDEPPARFSRRPAQGGVLQPPSSPVFPERHGATAGPGRDGTTPSTSTGRGVSPTAAIEPTIMVSIGRLEVRSATGSSAQQRREAPKASGLDDYLRQRGKASP